MRYSTYTPRIVRVSCDSLSILINDSTYVALKILDEVVGYVIVENTAHAVLVIVERNKRIAVPSLAENLSSVKRVLVLYTVYSLARSDTVCIVGVSVVVKRLKLSALFPSQSVTEIRGRVTLCIVGDRLTVVRGKEILPSIVAIYITDLGCFYNLTGFINYTLGSDVTVVVILELGGLAILSLSFKLTEGIVGIRYSAVNGIGNFNNSFFIIVLIRNGTTIGKSNMAYKLSGSGGLDFPIFFMPSVIAPGI